MATVPSVKFRDGKQALALAKKALEGKKDDQSYQALAAAYAELGQFEKSVELQKLAIKHYAVQTDNNRPYSKEKRNFVEYKEQLKSYERKRPWRTVIIK